MITSPSEGSLVAGEVTVAAEASDGTTAVDFSVSTDGGLTWTQLGIDTTPDDGWTATWQSGDYSGTAHLRASSNDGTSQATDEVSVSVDNKAPRVTVRASRRAFSPNGDGRKDITSLEAFADEAVDITLQIIDNQGAVRRSWSSSGMTRRLVVRWNGRNLRGRLPDGRYTALATGRDRVGSRDVGRVSLIIDTHGPRIRSLRVGPKLFERSGTLTAAYRLRDRSPAFAVDLQIRGHFGRIATVSRVTGSSAEIRFPTRYRDGTALYPGGYSARLLIRDDAGNVTRSRKTSWRMHRRVEATVFKRLNNVGRRVALTIDDCNDAGAWARMLRILGSFRTKATFFCSGQMVARYPDIARRTVRQGHAIGSHGWDHMYMMGKSQAETAWRIRADARIWWDVAGETTAPFYRPAYGFHDRNGIAAAGATGHGRVIMWDVDPVDYGDASASVVSERVIRETRPGSIVLLHVLDKTADALPSILRGLRQRDLEPVDLYRFFHAGGYR